MKISARMDNSGLKKFLQDTEKNVIPAATAAALNRAVQRTGTQTTRDVSSALRVPQKYIRARIRFGNRDRATRSRLDAKLYMVTRPLPVSAFGKPVRTKKGARVRGMVYPGSFPATMPKGHVGAYRRKSQSRFPLEEITRPIKEDLDRTASSNMDKIGVPEFEKRLQHEIRIRLKSR
jgi:hypothetical protein